MMSALPTFGERFFLFALVLVMISVNLFGGDAVAPFEIPPHGQPELLLGDIDFEAPTAMAFDSKNRPYLINNRNPESFGKIRTIRDGKWVTLSFADMFDKNAQPEKREMHAPGELVIDEEDSLYTTVNGKLVYSPDLGKTFKTYPCKGSLELRVSSAPMTSPPAICQIVGGRYVDRAAAKWARKGTLTVLLPEKTEVGLNLGEPIVISESCMTAGSGGHSGGTSFAVTVGQNLHVVYAETPDDLKAGGNPIHIATIDRKTRKVVATKFLVNAPPKVADVHTRPTITADSKGYLHVLSGSHGQPFFYMRSNRPGDTSEWTKPIQLQGRQCYASIVCDKNDRLHSVFREWIPHPSLGYSSAAAGGTWAKPVTLVDAAKTKRERGYGIFYHRLFIDRASNLYLSFTFFEFKTDKNGIYPEALIVSKDGGRTWQLSAQDSFGTQIYDE